MKAVTANRLTDGRVVYLTEDRQWTPDLMQAVQLDPASADEALNAALRDILNVVGPYLIEIENQQPAGQKHRRESIRLQGPTTGTTRSGVLGGA